MKTHLKLKKGSTFKMCMSIGAAVMMGLQGVLLSAPTFAADLQKNLLVVAPLKKERPAMYTYIAIIVVLASSLYTLIASRVAAKKADQEEQQQTMNAEISEQPVEEEKTDKDME